MSARLALLTGAWFVTRERERTEAEAGPDDVDEEARTRLLAAVKETPLVAEAAFLFSERFTVRLDHHDHRQVSQGGGP